MPEFYNMNNVFFLEKISRWSYIVKKARQNDIALLIDTALHTIEKDNKAKDPKQDLVGKVYEYFLSKFALAEGKGKGEFYTPKSIVNLIAEMIEPYKGIIYDPNMGLSPHNLWNMKLFYERYYQADC